jgi:type II secretory pathway pseudopilin PulG
MFKKVCLVVLLGCSLAVVAILTGCSMFNMSDEQKSKVREGIKQALATTIKVAVPLAKTQGKEAALKWVDGQDWDADQKAAAKEAIDKGIDTLADALDNAANKSSPDSTAATAKDDNTVVKKESEAAPDGVIKS